MSQTGQPRVSVLIKALNEAERIAACLEAAVREAESVGGEVILVDSRSRDATVEIARRYPVRIVQFDRDADRGCGAAVQLGYQHARGAYVYVLDADMVLVSGFLRTALAQLEASPDLAGVGGKLLDTSVSTAYDSHRVLNAARLTKLCFVRELGGGGLYRRRAIETVGHLAHRWLPAFEEAELGLRLRAAGWKLVRLPDVAVQHTGHAETTWGMFRRLWRNGRAQATGMFLRTAWGTNWWWLAVRKQWHVFFTPGLHLGTLAVAAAFDAGALPARWAMLDATAWLAVWLALGVRKRSLRLAGFSLIAWHYFTLAALVGVLRPLGSPREPIAGRDITVP